MPSVAPSMWAKAALLLMLLLAVVAGPALLIRATVRDMEPPLGLSIPVGEFGEVLAIELDMPPATHVRYVGDERRSSDQLVFLFFEFRTWPYLGPPTMGYLVSRCLPIDTLQPVGMGGGIVLNGDVNVDPELAYLRDVEAQPRCP